MVSYKKIGLSHEMDLIDTTPFGNLSQISIERHFHFTARVGRKSSETVSIVQDLTKSQVQHKRHHHRHHQRQPGEQQFPIQVVTG